LALGKKIIIVKNATAYTWDWYCHLVVDRATLIKRVSESLLDKATQHFENKYTNRIDRVSVSANRWHPGYQACFATFMSQRLTKMPKTQLEKNKHIFGILRTI
jgi:hypothetical protein